jgi:hypothetical protein
MECASATVVFIVVVIIVCKVVRSEPRTHVQLHDGVV